MDSANIEIFASILKRRFIQKALQSKTKRLCENLPKNLSMTQNQSPCSTRPRRRMAERFDDVLSPRERKFVIAPVCYFFMWSQRSEVRFLKGQDCRFSVRWPKCGLEHPFTSRLLHQKYVAKHNISSSDHNWSVHLSQLHFQLFSLFVCFVFTRSFLLLG